MMVMFCVKGFAQRDLSTGGRQLERMKSELSLSDEQYNKLKEVDKKFTGDQAKLRSDTSLTREKVMADRKTMFEKRDSAVREILSKDQHEKWMAMKPAPRQGRGIGRDADPIAELKSELGISDDQAQKISDINRRMTSQFERLRADTTVLRSERPAEVKRIIGERNEKIKRLLTEEQFNRFIVYEKEKTQRGRNARRMAPR